MDNNKDCCCFCFTARTGVIIIGVLMSIGCVFYLGDLAFLLFAETNTPGTAVLLPWQYIPAGIIQFILAIKFCQVMANERKPKDWETRKSFAKWYLILGVFVNAIC